MVNIEILSVTEKGRICLVDFIGDEKLYNDLKDAYENDGYGVTKVSIDTHYLSEEDADEINKYLLKEEFDLVVPIVSKETMDTLKESDEGIDKPSVED